MFLPFSSVVVFASQLTCRNAHKVVRASPIDLNVAIAHKVLVPAERQVPVLATLELDQGLAVAPTLATQTERHSASVGC